MSHPRPNRKTGQTKTCSICGVAFYVQKSHLSTRQFCDIKCKGIASRKYFQCEVCGVRTYSFKNKTKRFCGEECESLARRNGKTVPCAVCNAPVYVVKSRLGKPLHFCSGEHANLWQGRNKTKHICRICGQEFRWSPSRSKSKNYNIIYCSLSCRDADPERRLQLLKMNQTLQKTSTTRVEKRGYKLLDEINVPYERQALFANKFCVDAVFKRQKLVIQFDGDYWHGRKGILDKRVAKRVALDHSQDAYIAACGWKEIRLWESDLLSRPDWCQNRVIAALCKQRIKTP